MEPYDIDSVCFDPWTKRIRSYWRFLRGGECYVLLGKTDGRVILITQKHPDTGEAVYGLLMDEPASMPLFRNYLWHEMGHIKGEKSDDQVENESFADQWAIRTALKKGFTVVAEEILLRCTDQLLDKSVSSVYKSAARITIEWFKDLSKDIASKHCE